MSANAVRSGWSAWASSSVRRIGVCGTLASTTSATADDTAATVNAVPGEAAPTTAPATAGPMACPIVGRTIPSKPLTACRSDSGISAGSQAE